MPSGLNGRLYALEQDVLDDTPKTPTALYIDNKAEGDLHSRAKEIEARRKATAEKLYNITRKDPNAKVDIHVLDLTPEEQLIVNRSRVLFTHRVMELFENAVAQRIHLNDPVCKYVFYSRLNWFLSEMSDWLFLRWREDQVYSEPEFFDLCEGEQNRRLAPIYAEWRKDWLSPESWNRFYEQQPKLQIHMTPEQEAEEHDAKILAEKCPTCTEKCEWYFKNRVLPKTESGRFPNAK